MYFVYLIKFLLLLFIKFLKIDSLNIVINYIIEKQESQRKPSFYDLSTRITSSADYT